MTGSSTFLQLSSSSTIKVTNPVLHLNILWRQLELHFDLTSQDGKSGKYKIIIPFRYILADSFILNRYQPRPSHQSIFFQSSIPPQAWRRSEIVDDEDLKDRLYWNDQELWVRQCEIVNDLNDPLIPLMDTRVVMKHLMLPTGTCP
jgi:hypothetical protein